MMRLIFALLIAAATLFLPAAPPASAQAATFNCDGYDTAVYGTTFMGTMETCTVTTGPLGIIFAIDQGQVSCVSNIRVQLVVGTGASPINGSNFIGGVSSGVLTVTAPAQNGVFNSWLIQTGQILGLANAGASIATAVTGQLTQATFSVTGTISNGVGGSGNILNVTAVGSGTVLVGSTISGSGITGGTTITGLGNGSGGTGTYTVSVSQNVSSTTVSGTNPLGTLGTYGVANGSLSVSPGTNMYSLNPVPAGTVITPLPYLQESACQNGFIVNAVAGAFVGKPFSQYWVVLGIASDGVNNWATWNNHGSSIITW
jgi:hypothetical protein